MGNIFPCRRETYSGYKVMEELVEDTYTTRADQGCSLICSPQNPLSCCERASPEALWESERGDMANFSSVL